MTTIHPIHHSLVGKSLRTPYNMDRAKMDAQAKDALTVVALSIFADCCNVGTPFQDAILAVYLSGLQHGHSIARD